ncbi:disease resistance protein RGA3 [Canna indica]|uniref:Disease resistance protein RGA3 n=1 Tax=Canna indica TaxID=4628 RepID=A0AAQ3QA12_9LILI|nr:disease resistance protein RGA3 [Canna indica]
MDWFFLLSTLASLFSFLGLGEKVFDWAKSEVFLLRRVEDDVDKLRKTYGRIRAHLADAEDGHHLRDSLELWFLELKTLAFDTDSTSRKRKRGLVSDLLKRRSIGVEVASIQDKYREITGDRKKLCNGSSEGKEMSDAILSQASAFCERSRIIGRDDYCKQIVDALKAECNKDLPVVAIYGAAGIGKTALAQLVFDHFSTNCGREHFRNPFPARNRKGKQPIRQGTSYNPKPSQREKGKQALAQVEVDDTEHFELKIWVSLPKCSDVEGATIQIIEGKKFLLVIDNLWVEGYHFWENLRPPLVCGAKGSKVLVTTRNKAVWKVMAMQLEFHLEGLTVGDSWMLLRNLAFPDCDGYFNYLLCMSFFETTGKHEIKYRMSSLFHDLACHVSKNELLVMEDDELLSPPEQPRYASVHHQKEIPLSLGQLNEYKSLRALKLFGNSLHTLSRFTVTNDDTCNIGELNNLKLRGELCISKLENIVNVSEAPAANLMGKRYIDKLMLRWTDTSANSQTCEEVIDQLCPHSNLKHLWIVNYPGRRSPSWLDRSFSNLETLRLLNCRECEIPLSFHEQLPNLKILR